MMEDKAAVAAGLRDTDDASRCRFLECLETRDIDPDIFQRIIKLAREDSFVQVRLTAIRKLAPSWPDPDVARLFKALATDPEIQVADAAVGALCRTHDDAAKAILLEAYLKAPHFGYKWLVFEGLTTAWSFSEIESIILGYMLADSDEVIRASTVSYVGRQHDANLIADLIQLLHDGDSRVRANALEALGHFKQVVDRNIFIDMLSDPNHRVQSAAMVIVDELGGVPLDGRLTAMVQHSSEMMRASAIYVLRARPAMARREHFLEELSDDSSSAVQRQLKLV